MTWALLAGPVIGLISAGYIRLIGWMPYHRASGTRALYAPVLAFGVLGVIGWSSPSPSVPVAALS